MARTVDDIGPALERALAHRPEPDGSFARRPSTASLILSDERRSGRCPAWRVRTARAVAGTTAAARPDRGVDAHHGASYSLVSHFVHMRPVTAVATSRPEVGVLVDAPASEIPAIANLPVRAGHPRVVHARAARAVAGDGGRGLRRSDRCRRLPNGGLVRWIGARDQLRDLIEQLGFHHHFLYASSGPSVGQWWMARGAGGRLVAGAVRLEDKDDRVGNLHAGEVIELTVTSSGQCSALVGKLDRRLSIEHLRAVPVAQMMRDAGSSV